MVEDQDVIPGSMQELAPAGREAAPRVIALVMPTTMRSSRMYRIPTPAGGFAECNRTNGTSADHRQLPIAVPTHSRIMV